MNGTSKAFLLTLTVVGAAMAAPTTVVVSRDYGFDPEDSTRFLQAALSSGAAKVVVDRQASDWVTTTVTGAPNQTVVFEKGVTLRAKPGEFHGRQACLLKYVCCTNVTISGYGATLRMERDAYSRPPYTKSEHRHALSVRGGGDFRVEGLTLEESGGDGIYIVPLRVDDRIVSIPENISMKDVKCVRNYRQGMSVIAVKGLVCENCEFSETAGTPPQSGVDFEPNYPEEILQDIVFRGCRFENNKGRGFEFYLGMMNSNSAPVTARFENCSTLGGINGFEYQQKRKSGGLPIGGRLELIGCTFEKSTRSGILIIDKPETSASIQFRDCRVVDCCTVATNGPDVRLQTRRHDTPPVGGVDFGNLEIRQPFPRQKFTEPLAPVAPTDGATVPLLNARQKAFLTMSREERAAFFDDDHPGKSKEIKLCRSKPIPVRLEWRGGSAPFEVSVTKRGAKEPWLRMTVETNGVPVRNLEIAATYDWTVRGGGGESIGGSFVTEDLAPRLVGIPKVPNMRDMGGRVINGRRVRQGLVFRSSGLNDNATTNGPGAARLTEEWRKYMTERLGIRTDIDLRGIRERAGMEGSPLGTNVNYITMPTNYHGYAAVHTVGADDTRRVLRVFLDRRNYPIDFHCIGGADRTGTVATILHGILGLEEDEIWKDWQITAWHGGINDAKHLKWFADFVKSFDRFEGDTLSDRIRNYVLWLGFTEKEMETFRDIMLESR